MNKAILLAATILLLFTGCKDSKVNISGTITGVNKGSSLYLDELRGDELVTIDSVQIEEDGSFNISQEVISPAFYLLKTDETNFLTMLLEPGKNVEILAKADSLNFPIKITGSEGTQKMVDYNRKLSETIAKLGGLRDVYMASIDTPQLPVVMEKLDSTAQAYLEEISTYTKSYIDDNMGSLVTLVALFQQVAPGEYILHPEKDVEYFKKVDASLMELYPDYGPVKTLHEQLQTLVADVDASAEGNTPSGSGAVVPEIALPNPDGDTIRLSSTRGKVVLLDFWAAWCAPCRRENPNLVAAYNKYKSKGFEIYQVSLDKTKEAWMKGIEDDKLNQWIHVSDLKYWNASVVQQFGLESIPASLLLDREGRVIASNLRGEALEKKLEEVLK